MHHRSPPAGSPIWTGPPLWTTSGHARAVHEYWDEGRITQRTVRFATTHGSAGHDARLGPPQGTAGRTTRTARRGWVVRVERVGEQGIRARLRLPGRVARSRRPGWVRRPRVTGAQARTGAAYAVVWLLLALPIAAALFFTSEESTTVASHDAEIRPTADGYVTLRTGPFLPDVRAPSGSRVGVEVTLGKTESGSTEELVARYAFIASQPDAQIERVGSAVKHLAYDAAVRGAVLALVPLVRRGGWSGERRRRELLDRLDLRRFSRTLLVGGLVLALAAAAPGPAVGEREPSDAVRQLRLAAARRVRHRGVGARRGRRTSRCSTNSTTNSTKRLVLSAIDTYRQSKTYYAAAAEAAANCSCAGPSRARRSRSWSRTATTTSAWTRWPARSPTRPGPRSILDAGDDTSTGSTWEAFSLDSLDNAFEDYAQRFAVAGNHDNGSFVAAYLDEAGLDHARPARSSTAPAAAGCSASDDPRSSGLGNWRDETRAQPSTRSPRGSPTLACEADDAGDRVNTVLVHDADMGAEALRRGCVDLVRRRPRPRAGRAGPGRSARTARIGYTYTNGTTGGAAYAIAVGSKLRRPARGDAGDLPRRPAGRAPAGDGADERGLPGRRLHAAPARLRGSMRVTTNVDRLLPTDEAEALLELTREIAAKELAPQVHEAEERAAFPEAAYRLLGEVGLLRLPVRRGVRRRRPALRGLPPGRRGDRDRVAERRRRHQRAHPDRERRRRQRRRGDAGGVAAAGCSAATGSAPTASPSRRPAPTSARSGPGRSATATSTSSTAPSSGSATAPAPTTTSSSPAPSRRPQARPVGVHRAGRHRGHDASARPRRRWAWPATSPPR